LPFAEAFLESAEKLAEEQVKSQKAKGKSQKWVALPIGVPFPVLAIRINLNQRRLS